MLGFGQKNGALRAIRPSSGCNGAAVRLQRAPRCNPIAAPLQSRKGSAAATSRPFPKVEKKDKNVSGCVAVSCKKGAFSVRKSAIFDLCVLAKFGGTARKFWKVPPYFALKFRIFRTNHSLVTYLPSAVKWGDPPWPYLSYASLCTHL